MKKSIKIIHEQTISGFVIWFAIGISSVFSFYSPFEQPVFFDRAYLLYMSQVVFRGDSLYSATTFGYTPLSVLLVGGVMKIGALFSINTIISARIAGLLLYGFMCGSFFALLKKIFNDHSIPWIGTLLFVGLGFLQILSGINAEPKTFVLTFTILGMYFFVKRNWLMVGVCFSAGAMCWQVASISILACTIVLPWNSVDIKSILLKFLVGIFLATVPVLIYLGITNGWTEFWDQAILRKLMVEGSSLGESPWRWLIKSIHPRFLPETGHFVLGFIGFIVLLISQFHPIMNSSSVFKKKEIIRFILVFCTIWAIFNSLEFQGPPDIFPLIGITVILGTFLISITKHWIKGNGLKVVSIVALIFYNMFDGFFYTLPFTYTEEKALVADIHKEYGDPFVIGFEEYYAISEKAMPTKYMRMAPYEDYFLMRDGECEKVHNTAKKINFIILKNQKMNDDLESTLINNNKGFRESKAHKRDPNPGECANQIIETMTTSIELDSFKIQTHKITLRKTSVRDINYSIYRNIQFQN